MDAAFMSLERHERGIHVVMKSVQGRCRGGTGVRERLCGTTGTTGTVGTLPRDEHFSLVVPEWLMRFWCPWLRRFHCRHPTSPDPRKCQCLVRVCM
jgi:hypothetical protein